MNKQWFYSKISSFYNEDDIGRIESIYLEDEENDLEGLKEKHGSLYGLNGICE